MIPRSQINLGEYLGFRQLVKQDINASVAKPPKCLGPPTPVIVLRTSDGDAGDPSTLEVR